MQRTLADWFAILACGLVFGFVLIVYAQAL